VIALSRLGQLLLLKGELHRAEKITQQALDVSRHPSGRYLSVASLPLMSLANLKYELNELETALDLIQHAVQLSDESGGFWSIDCYLVFAFVLQAHGNAEDAREAMRKARNIASQTSANRFDDIYSAAYETQLSLIQGNLDEAIQWTSTGLFTNREETEYTSNERPYSPSLFHLAELELMTFAKVLLARREPDNALDILAALFFETQKRGRTISIVENLALQAQAMQLKGMTEEAMSKLETALVLAEPIGYIRVFLDEGKLLQDLMIKLTARWNSRGKKDMTQPTFLEQYVQRLILAFDPTTRSREKSLHSLKSSWATVFLTQRECDVLSQLAEGYSNKEIAQNLMIANGTVHKHLKNIYTKLDVHNRTAAVARGRELGFL